MRGHTRREPHSAIQSSPLCQRLFSSSVLLCVLLCMSYAARCRCPLHSLSIFFSLSRPCNWLVSCLFFAPPCLSSCCESLSVAFHAPLSFDCLLPLRPFPVSPSLSSFHEILHARWITLHASLLIRRACIRSLLVRHSARAGPDQSRAPISVRDSPCASARCLANHYNE